jgi:hypothetical protein
LVRSCRRELFMGKGIKVVIGGRVINLMREREREREIESEICKSIGR